MSVSSFEELDLETGDIEELLQLSSLWSEQGSFDENSEFFQHLNNLTHEQVKKAYAEMVKQNKQIEQKYEGNKKKFHKIYDHLQEKEKTIKDLNEQMRDLKNKQKTFDRNVEKIKDQSIEIDELKQEVERKIHLISGLEEKVLNLEVNRYQLLNNENNLENKEAWMANVKDELHNKIIAYNELDEMFRLNEKQMKLLKENYSNLDYAMGENERKYFEKEKNYESEIAALQTCIEKKKIALENMKSKIKDLNSKPANMENIKRLQSENQFNLLKLKEKDSLIQTLQNSNKQLSEDVQIQKNNVVKLEEEIKNIKLLNFGTSNKKSSNNILTKMAKKPLEEKSNLPSWWKVHMK